MEMATVSVRYIVDDVDAAIAFYTRHLGFDEVMHPAPTFAMLARGDLRLVLSAPSGAGDEITYHTGGLADDDIYKPSYDKGDITEALTRERAAETAGEQRVRELEDKGDYDQLRAAAADLGVRRRFIASLAACETNGMTCPPRLDDPAWSFDIEADVDPKLDIKLRFDLDSWRKVSAELHGRACACRTLACVLHVDGVELRHEVFPAL